jgi:hypothetical protein
VYYRQKHYREPPIAYAVREKPACRQKNGAPLCFAASRTLNLLQLSEACWAPPTHKLLPRVAKDDGKTPEPRENRAQQSPKSCRALREHKLSVKTLAFKQE